MTPDIQIALAEKSGQALAARQYVLRLVEEEIESTLTTLESTLGGATFQVERVLTTLGGIMAARRLRRKVDADIKRGQTPPGQN